MRLCVQGSLVGGSCFLDEGPASLALITDLQKYRETVYSIQVGEPRARWPYFYS